MEIKIKRKSGVLTTGYAGAIAATKTLKLVYGELGVVRYKDTPAAPKTKALLSLGYGDTGSTTSVDFEPIATIEDMGVLEASITSIQQTLTSLTGDMTTAKADITGLKSRMTAAEGNITTVTTNIGTISSLATTAKKIVDAINEVRTLALTGIKSGNYNPTTNELILVLNNDTTIKIPAKDLIEDWDVEDTSSVDLTKTNAGTPNGVMKLKAKVKLSGITTQGTGNSSELENALEIIETPRTLSDGTVLSEGIYYRKPKQTLEDIQFDRAIEKSLGSFNSGTGVQSYSVKVRTDDKSIIVNTENKLEVGVIDCGEY